MVGPNTVGKWSAILPIRGQGRSGNRRALTSALAVGVQSPLLAALRAADESVGNQSRMERSSTDANIPSPWESKPFPSARAVTAAERIRLQEWYDSAGRELGLKRALLTLLGIAGVAEEKSR